MLPFNRAGTLAWYINGRLLKRRAFGLVQVKLLNQLTPLLRRLDGVLPLPPLSLIAVLTPSARPRAQLSARIMSRFAHRRNGRAG